MATSKLNEELEATLSRLQQYNQLLDEARLQQAALQERSPPVLEPVSVWDQIDPFRTPRAKLMAWYFETYGVIGLAYYIVEIAKFEAKDEAKSNRAENFSQQVDVDNDNSGEITDDGNDDEGLVRHSQSSSPNQSESGLKYDKSWDLILDDGRHNDYQKIIRYLSSLPIALIRALIAGNLPSRMQDASFRQEMEDFVTLSDRQGTYGIWVARKEESFFPDSLHTIYPRGMGLSLRQLMNVHKTMSQYIDITDAQSANLAIDIDLAFSGFEKKRETMDYSYQRRYGSGSDNDRFGHHEHWLSYIEKYYIRQAKRLVGKENGHLLERPMERCFVYVGLSKSVLNRAPDHWTHKPRISPVAGLLRATLEFLYPQVFSVVSSSFQIFKTTAKADIGFDEKLSMLLTSAYPWDGGLNADYAGRSRGHKDDSEMSLQKLKDSQAEIDASGLVQLHINNSQHKIGNLATWLNEQRESPKLRRELTRKVNENIQRVEGLVQEAEAQKLRLEAVLLSKTVEQFEATAVLERQSRCELDLD